MNFLAHLYLSRDDDELMIGNFIADSVKGSAFNNYPERVRKGILLHRAIDSFTDTHPVFLESVNRLRPIYHKYAGVIMDIFYDHFLAKNWSEHASESLEDFTKRVHRLLLARRMDLPENSRHFLQYMLLNNIPMPYADISGIEKVLYGMSRRTKFNSGMENAGNELKLYYRDFEREFNLFFPDVVRFVEKKNQ
jgi:acyl carrier protein phosphodiesterase